MSKRFGLLLLVGILAVGCATTPTGRRQLMLVSEQDAISASAQAYVQQIAPLQQSGKIDNHPKVTARVRKITERLIAQAIIMRPATRDWDWTVRVIDDPDVVNAWCMAGGRMAIYTGLIQQIDPTDDELAQVMGHEIAHALANHTAEKMSMTMATSLGVLAVGVATDNRGITAGAAAAATLAVTLPNSRTAESEADRIGIELAARAGYDPRAAVTLWQKMGEVGGARPPQFLSTHPGPESRQAELARLIPQMMPYYQSGGTRPVYQLRSALDFERSSVTGHS